MWRWLCIPACLVVMAGAAVAQTPMQAPLDPAGYTRAIAQAITKALPGREVAVTGEFEIVVSNGDGTSATVSVANLYADYRREPARLAEIADAYAKALTRPVAAARRVSVERTRIVPVIKDRAWLAANNRAIAARSPTQQLVADDFNAELVIAYAEDGAGRIRYLTSADDLSVAREDLRKVAVDNLIRIMPKIEMRAHDDVFALISAGGDYEASLLLLDGIWRDLEGKYEGELVVAVPAKDVLLVTGSRNAKGLDVVRKIAADIVAKQRYALTDVLFVYREGRFARLEP